MAMTVSVPNSVYAAGEFEKGFRSELGAVAARTAVDVVFKGMFGNSSGNGVFSSNNSARSNDQYYRPTSRSNSSSYHGEHVDPDRYRNDDRLSYRQYNYRQERSSIGNYYTSRPIVVVQEPAPVVYTSTTPIIPAHPHPTPALVSTGLSFSKTTLFKTNILRQDLREISVKVIAWQDLQKILAIGSGNSAQAVATTEGIAFSDNTMFRVSSLESELGSLRVENIAWQDLQKMLARSLS
ncbi:MAG: hypothetical protein JKX97_03720 [Candidatus Lindowbacteria bacterium]|nr:hypothetical protein [Candidatus Lindowbacteria bacterium]